MMNEWLELIERNEEQIINTGIEAYKEAIENTQIDNILLFIYTYKVYGSDV